MTAEREGFALLEPARLQEIAALGLVSGVRDETLDGYVREAASAASAPVALISVVLGEAQHFAAQHGLGGWLAEANGTPVEWSFCRHVVEGGCEVVITDASTDPRVKESPLVAGEGLRCYAGIPLVTTRGHTVGTLCVLGTTARDFDPQTLGALRALAVDVVAYVEGRRRE